MKLLINLCSHDGMISHYTGVGTMVKRNIIAMINYLKENNIDYQINLITPEYNQYSFGYSKKTKNDHIKLNNVNIIQISNGSNGKINYGSPEQWKTFSLNVANYINNININKYDKIISIFHDTTLAGVIKQLKNDSKHKKVWIPHSTIKIHKVDSAIVDSKTFYKLRVKWEQDDIDNINESEFSYVGVVGKFIKKHLIEEYNLNPDKALDITNGEIFKNNIIKYSKDCKKLYKNIEKFNSIMISFARAEDYKNLQSAMILGKENEYRYDSNCSKLL